jgi:hypothetical protein
MACARTQEERDIARRTAAHAFRLARADVYVIFHKLPGHTLAQCWPGIWRLKKYGMRTFQHNPIIYDLPKIRAGNWNLEDTIIHECMHLKLREKETHSNNFACEMKREIGVHEWGIAVRKEGED